LTGLWRDILRSLPLLLPGLIILGLSLVAGKLAARKSRRVLRDRIQARLLRNVIAGGIGVLVFLVGTYIVLRVSGLHPPDKRAAIRRTRWSGLFTLLITPQTQGYDATVGSQ